MTDTTERRRRRELEAALVELEAAADLVGELFELFDSVDVAIAAARIDEARTIVERLLERAR